MSEIREIVIKTLDEMKGVDTVCLDVRKMTGVTDFMVVVTGNSGRHVKSLADSVVDAAKESGFRPIGVEGLEGAEGGEWVLVDLSDVVVHVMKADTRDFYQIERLWDPEIEDSLQEG